MYVLYNQCAYLYFTRLSSHCYRYLMHFRKKLKIFACTLTCVYAFYFNCSYIIVEVVPCCVALNGFLESNM